MCAACIHFFVIRGEIIQMDHAANLQFDGNLIPASVIEYNNNAKHESRGAQMRK